MLRLPFRPPFDWDGVHSYLAARAIPGVEVVRAGHYARTVSSAGAHGIVRVARTTDDALVLTVEGRFPDAAARVARLFDLDADPDVVGRALLARPLKSGSP